MTHLYIFVVGTVNKYRVVDCYQSARQHQAFIGCRVSLTLQRVLVVLTDGRVPPPVNVVVGDVQSSADSRQLGTSAAGRVATPPHRGDVVGDGVMVSVVGGEPWRCDAIAGRGPAASGRPARRRVV